METKFSTSISIFFCVRNILLSYQSSSIKNLILLAIFCSHGIHANYTIHTLWWSYCRIHYDVSP